jgi:hypothetical protein
MAPLASCFHCCNIDVGEEDHCCCWCCFLFLLLFLLEELLLDTPERGDDADCEDEKDDMDGWISDGSSRKNHTHRHKKGEVVLVGENTAFLEV